MKARNGIVFLIVLLSISGAQGQVKNDSVLYRQDVIRDDMMFVEMFKYKRGVVVLTEDSLLFDSKTVENSKFNFHIPYKEIRSIRPFYGFLIPNRIKIRTKNGESFRLFTYKKKNIIEITRARMNKI